jgi:opacity protein-like surface antigen
MIRSIRLGVFCAFILGLALPAAAQEPGTTRFTVGGSFIISQPREEFRLNVGNGYGGNGTMLYHLLRSGLVNLRVDFSGAQYDSETIAVPLSPTIGGRILVDVTTRNSILTLSVGPELAKPTGRIRPYVNVAASRLFFRTTSSVQGVDDDNGDFADTTNHSDGTGAWVYGGGLRFPLGRVSSPLTLDLGIRYHRGGEASYLKEGSILDAPDGSIAIFPLTSRTPFLMYTFGVQFRIPHGSSSCPKFLC